MAASTAASAYFVDEAANNGHEKDGSKSPTTSPFLEKKTTLTLLFSILSTHANYFPDSGGYTLDPHPRDPSMYSSILHQRPTFELRA